MKSDALIAMSLWSDMMPPLAMLVVLFDGQRPKGGGNDDKGWAVREEEGTSRLWVFAGLCCGCFGGHVDGRKGVCMMVAVYEEPEFVRICRKMNVRVDGAYLRCYDGRVRRHVLMETEECWSTLDGTGAYLLLYRRLLDLWHYLGDGGKEKFFEENELKDEDKVGHVLWGRVLNRCEDTRRFVGRHEDGLLEAMGVREVGNE